MESLLSFQALLQRSRLLSKQSQRKFAKRIGVSQTSYSSWERGHTPSRLSPSLLAKISKIAGVSLEVLTAAHSKQLEEPYMRAEAAFLRQPLILTHEDLAWMQNVAKDLNEEAPLHLLLELVPHRKKLPAPPAPASPPEDH